MTNKIFTLLALFMVCLGMSAQSVQPVFSTADAPVWYKVVFKSKSAALADQGDGTILKTASQADGTAQKWRFSGSATNCKMVSANGNWVTYDSSSSRFKTVSDSTKAVALRIVKGSADNYWEIQRTTVTANCMNQFGGGDPGKEIGEWTLGDNGNQLSFFDLTPILPEFSQEGEPGKFYFIYFAASSLYFAQPANEDVMRLAVADATEGQMWKFVGTKDNFQLVSKNGKYAYVSNTQLPANGSAAPINEHPMRFGDTPQTGGFKLQEAPKTTYGAAWEIAANNAPYTESSKADQVCMNVWGSPGNNNSIGFWKTNDNNNCLKFTAVDDMTYPDFKVEGIASYTPENAMTLWYNQPATTSGVADTWMEYSLPIGNGQFGGSLFGGIEKDEIVFNDKTLWSGSNKSYGYYLKFGSLYAQMLDAPFGYGSDQAAKDYLRQLDLTTGQGKVTFKSPDDAVTYTREYLASAPDQCIAVRYAATGSGNVNLLFSMESGKPGVVATPSYSGADGCFSGKLDLVSYNARFRVVNTGGTVEATAEGVKVTGADEVLLILAGGTDFSNDNDTYLAGTAQLAGKIESIVADAATKGWTELSDAQVADHQKYMGRVTLDLGQTANNVPTNELVDAYAHGSGTNPRLLEALYFNYGRYLEICSSRGVDLPSNLQGIWNNSSTPPWHSDIHANINVQMNYWPAESGNMSEMHLPFLNHIMKQATERPEWQQHAVNYGHQTGAPNFGAATKGWTLLTENNIFGAVSTFATNYVIANAWYCSHIWQHYRYTLDKDFLTRAFPTLWSCAEYWTQRLVKADDGTYECPLEYSPEHGPGAENATAHSQQLVWELFDNVSKAIDILGNESTLDATTLADFREKFANLDRGLAVEEYTGTWGTDRIATGTDILREWKYSRFSSGENNHRHMSHLMCLYPFSQISPSSPYFEPAINSMKLRGDASTGWSMGWKINLWARARNAERAMNVISTALRHSTSYGTNQSAGGIYYNLYDSHAPFQIDGNFGATAGVIEMLMQSATDTIAILPALPEAWANGSVKGLKAIGDFTVDVEWAEGAATYAKIVSNQGAPLFIENEAINNAMISVNGAEVKAQGVSANVVKVEAQKGDVVTIDFTQLPTSIGAIAIDTNNVEKAVYTLDGRRVKSTTTKGVYIVDGKKVVK